jgi:hypothetical protein
MDGLLAIGSMLPPLDARSPASRDAELPPYAQDVLPAETSLAATAKSVPSRESADDKQRMMHFISHVDAECFIALLKVMDPKPDDYRARAEYRRYYNQLRETLTTPLPPEDLGPRHRPTP